MTFSGVLKPGEGAVGPNQNSVRRRLRGWNLPATTSLRGRILCPRAFLPCAECLCSGRLLHEFSQGVKTKVKDANLPHFNLPQPSSVWSQVCPKGRGGMAHSAGAAVSSAPNHSFSCAIFRNQTSPAANHVSGPSFYGPEPTPSEAKPCSLPFYFPPYPFF